MRKHPPHKPPHDMGREDAGPMEDLGERYYKLEYFERTTEALRSVLLEKGHFTEDELNAKIAEILTRDTLVGVTLSKVSR